MQECILYDEPVPFCKSRQYVQLDLIVPWLFMCLLFNFDFRLSPAGLNLHCAFSDLSDQKRVL